MWRLINSNLENIASLFRFGSFKNYNVAFYFSEIYLLFVVRVSLKFNAKVQFFSFIDWLVFILMKKLDNKVWEGNFSRFSFIEWNLQKLFHMKDFCGITKSKADVQWSAIQTFWRLMVDTGLNYHWYIEQIKFNFHFCLTEIKIHIYLFRWFSCFQIFQ